MIPHTVPNRPMNGVMLAVVARKGTRFSSLLTSTDDARSKRAIDGRQALQGRTWRGAAGTAGGRRGCRSWRFSSA